MDKAGDTAIAGLGIREVDKKEREILHKELRYLSEEGTNQGRLSGFVDFACTAISGQTTDQSSNFNMIHIVLPLKSCSFS